MIVKTVAVGIMAFGRTRCWHIEDEVNWWALAKKEILEGFQKKGRNFLSR
jgi:hypothetical protein